MSTPSAQILVIRGGAIGDFIVTLPVLTALRKQFPNVRIELVAYERVAELAVRSGLADAWRPIESRGLASFFARGGVLEPEWQDYFARFPVIISHLFDPDGYFQANVAKSSRAQFIQSIHRPDEKSPLHATDQLLKPLERLAIFDADPVPALKLGNVAESPGSPPAIALHPGSGSGSKNWPLDRWHELVVRLVAERTDPLLLIGGEADQPRIDRLVPLIPEPRRRLLLNRPLTEVAEALSQARFFIGHDSGISHLAAAVGLSGAVLWGPSNDQVWRPRSDRFHLLHGPSGLVSVTPDVIMKIVALR